MRTTGARSWQHPRMTPRPLRARLHVEGLCERIGDDLQHRAPGAACRIDGVHQQQATDALTFTRGSLAPCPINSGLVIRSALNKGDAASSNFLPASVVGSPIRL